MVSCRKDDAAVVLRREARFSVYLYIQFSNDKHAKRSIGDIVSVAAGMTDSPEGFKSSIYPVGHWFQALSVCLAGVIPSSF